MWKQVMAAAFPVAAAGLYMWKEAFRNEVKETVITDDRFPEKAPLALFFISDIHRRLVHQSVIAEVSGRADAVIIGGDLCEGGVNRKRIRENVKRLSSIAPVYFVPGNNDYEVSLEQLALIFEEWQVTVLKNGSVPLSDDVYLLGTDDLSKGKSDKAALFHNVPPDAFKIIASHNPAFIRTIGPRDRVAVVLSGHTHGGQIRLGRWGMYEKGRWKKVGNTHVLVSNGYGTTGVPLRLGARAETHFITICRPEQTI
ncbi:metallophosphoesterase [Domibacillus robiginosus]|uniref:metallophosphoesterase n=1 Tax=Domibacillus robiginosus TaxID=1071054 RepID=UPI000A6CC7D6|nr:metallophosphoesterase [Domibacillus robiginosus]